MSESNAAPDAGLTGDEETDVSADSMETDDDESSPAEDFGTRLGVPLALLALAWAFVGPAHLLELGRYELPIVASFVEPTSYAFFLYLAGVTFVIALAGALSFPSRTDEPQDDYAGDLATGLIIPTIVVVVAMVALGFVFPALFYAVTGELMRAGLILVGVVVAAVAALILQTIVLLAVAVVSAPLWAPAFAGAYAGSFLRRVVA